MNVNKLVALFVAISVYFTSFSQFTDTMKILPEPYLNNVNEDFGNSVAIDGDFAVVGAPGYWDWSGYVVLLHYNGSSWEIVTEIYPEINRIDNNFGGSLAIDGNIIAIGIPGDAGVGTVSLYEITDNNGDIGVSSLGTLYPSDFDRGIHFGYSIAIDDSIIVVGTNSYGNKSKPVYVFVRPQGGWQTMSETYTLHASDQLASDFFGYSVDIKNGLIAVGAPFKDVDTATQAGTVYIFDISNGFQTDTQTAIIQPPELWNSAHFGISLALSDNYLLVGADQVLNCGRAYVYTFSSANGWSSPQLQAKLRPNSEQAYSGFGFRVDLEDDLAVVSAYELNLSSNNQGAVYVFDASTGWSDMTETAVLTASDGALNDRLGFSLALQGSRVLAGAPKNTIRYSEEGRVYYYEKATAGWSDMSETQIIDPPQHLSNAFDLFGNSVAKCGDVVAIGSPGYHGNKGCVFVYQKIGNGWTKIAELRPSDTSGVYKFGEKLAMTENLIVVGAPSSGQGRVFLFEKPNGGWTDMTETAQLYPSNNSQGGSFGYAIDIYGDTIAVSDYVYYNFGKVYVFVKPAGGWSGTVNEMASFYGGDFNANYRGMWGISLKLAENILLIGVPQDLTRPYNSGTVRVFTKSGSQSWADLSQSAVLITNDQATDQWLGFSVDYENGIVVAGATYDNYKTGAVYVFAQPSGGWSDTVSAILKIVPQGLSNYDYFGYKVAIEDTMLYVSSYFYDYTNPSTGGVFVYRTQDNGNTFDSLTLLGPDVTNFIQLYGASLDADGNSIIIGAPGTDDNDYKSGAAYIYGYPAVVTRVEENRSLTFFPNPVKDYLVVNALEGEVLIYDISGHVVKKVKAAGTYPAINVSDLSPGIYVIKLRNDRNMKSTKFIKL